MNLSVPIYLADDEDDARFLLCRILEKAGLGPPAATFNDGEDFLHYWDDGSPHGPGLLLLDLDMPRLNGFDVLFALQQRASASQLKTIVVSVSDRDEDISRAARLGANGYLRKYPKPGVLATVINETLRLVCRP